MLEHGDLNDWETPAMPKMFIPATWEAMGASVSDKVKRYGK